MYTYLSVGRSVEVQSKVASTAPGGAFFMVAPPILRSSTCYPCWTLFCGSKGSTSKVVSTAAGGAFFMVAPPILRSNMWYLHVFECWTLRSGSKGLTM